MVSICLDAIINIKHERFIRVFIQKIKFSFELKQNNFLWLQEFCIDLFLKFTFNRLTNNLNEINNFLEKFGLYAFQHRILKRILMNRFVINVESQKKTSLFDHFYSIIYISCKFLEGLNEIHNVREILIEFLINWFAPQCHNFLELSTQVKLVLLSSSYHWASDRVSIKTQSKL
ncbi:hypothetical protein BpHYR1_011075 [Brachionus plicatilis]|uniref:Uncharacterized protein n=1 Tax=Brachionus plicatilis TaxID=10195 RepID=A0A3M7RY34_BRAPC|nr:hypothetical protein BpHYR1_011075 [Brachionus plicatilis]